MATKFNQLVQIQFSEDIQVLNFTQCAVAFKATFQQQEYYEGPWEDVEISCLSVCYGKNIDTSLNQQYLILDFGHPKNFRKALTPVTVTFTSALCGGIYGKLPKDILGDFVAIFTPTNIDMYQNPGMFEYANIKETHVNNIICRPIINYPIQATWEYVKVREKHAHAIIITQVGEIKP